MPLIDSDFLASLISAVQFRELFDPDGTGTADTARVTRAIAAAESRAYLILNAGGKIILPLDRDGSTVDEGIKCMIGQMALYEATRYNPSNGAGSVKSPFREGYDDAVKALRDLASDQQRPVTAGNGERPYPRASSTPELNVDGLPGGAFNRAADGRDVTGF